MTDDEFTSFVDQMRARFNALPCGHTQADRVGDPPFCGPCAVGGAFDGVDADAFVAAQRDDDAPDYQMPNKTVIG